MTKPKHTPGPWELKQFGGPQISGPKGYAVCTMWGALSVSELRGQDAANSRLIAAAPDLLAALSSAVKWLAISDDPRCEKDLHAAEAALAAAQPKEINP